MKKIVDIAVSGSFEHEGHSVIFIEDYNPKKNKSKKVEVKELYMGGGWQTNNRPWSTTRHVSRSDAINEQDKLIKLGYQRTN